MKNIKKGVGKVAAVGLISMLSLGGLSSVALAAGEEFSDPQEYKESMTVGGELTVVNQEDTNNDGLITEGDMLSLNLHIENTSDTDYNYVDVSSYALQLDRVKLTDTLPAGDSIDYPISYTVSEGDEVYGSAYHNVVVNVRDETRIENSTEFDFFESVDTNVDVVKTSNSQLTGLVMDKDSKNIYVSSIDEYDNYYGIDESRLVEDYHSVSVGDGYVSGFDFTNDSDETITLDKVEFVNNVIEENVSGTVVEPGETVNLYVISEITRDDLDWKLSNAKVSAGGENVVVVSDTNNTNYIIESGQTMFPGNDMWLNVNGEAVLNEDKEAGSVETTYSFSAESNSPTIVVDGVNSEEFGYIESNHTLTDDTVVEVAAPETIVLEDGGTFEDTAYVVHRGAYHSLDVFLDTADVWTTYNSDTGAGVGDTFPEPSLTNPVCGEEAQPVLPSLDEHNEGREENGIELIEWLVEREGNVYNIYVVDYSFPMIMEEYQLEIPAVVPCPVVEVPDYEEPVFVGPTCDSPASLTTPESNEFYNYFSNGFETADGIGGFTVEVRNAETDELLDTWEFEYTNPTDCDPVVEIPDYEVPTFVPGTCDTDYELNVPENTEHYNYFSSSVSTPDNPTVMFEVQVYSNKTEELLDTWTFEYVVPTDCDPVDPPVEEETPEPPVEEIVPPVVEDKPETPVKEVPKKVNSGEVSEVVEDNNVAVFALIAGVGVVIALTTGIVLVRSSKK